MMGLALFVYAALAAFFFPIYRYAINTDATSYISIAEKYARGEWAAAVNGIWQPLFSWLIAVPVLLGIDPLLSARIVQLACGAATLVACGALAARLSLSRGVRGVLLVTLAPVVIQMAYFTLTPDLLFCWLAMAYFSVALDPAFPSDRQPLVCGLLAGLAFLAKAYALPFFAAHYCLINAFQSYRHGSWKQLFVPLAAGAAPLVLLISAWSVPLSLKYGEFTVCKAFGFNASASLAGDWPIPVRFRPPVNPTALSVWEDPSYIRLEKMPRLDMSAIIKRTARRTAMSSRDALGIVKRFSPLSFAAIVLALSACGVPGACRRDPAIPALLGSAGLLIAGYLPVNLETRYIWPALILLVMLAFTLVSRAFPLLKALPRRWVLLALCLSFISGPLTLMKYSPGPERPSQKDAHAISRTLSRLGVAGRIASDSEWEYSLYLSFFLKSRYFGEEQPGITDRELARQLDVFGIDYFLVWCEGRVPAFLSARRELTGGAVPGLRVYRLRGGL